MQTKPGSAAPPRIRVRAPARIRIGGSDRLARTNGLRENSAPLGRATPDDYRVRKDQPWQDGGSETSSGVATSGKASTESPRRKRRHFGQVEAGQAGGGRSPRAVSRFGAARGGARHASTFSCLGTIESRRRARHPALVLPKRVPLANPTRGPVPGTGSSAARRRCAPSRTVPGSASRLPGQRAGDDLAPPQPDGVTIAMPDDVPGGIDRCSLPRSRSLLADAVRCRCGRHCRRR